MVNYEQVSAKMDDLKNHIDSLYPGNIVSTAIGRRDQDNFELVAWFKGDEIPEDCEILGINIHFNKYEGDAIIAY